VAAAIMQTDVTFMVVPTPSEPNGAFSLKYVLAAAKTVGKALQYKDAFHVVVLTSTVMPGDTGGSLLPALEQHSGKRCGQDFGLCYSPEFIALGSVIYDMLHPDFILIGQSDPQSGNVLSQLFQTFCNNTPPIYKMAFVNAELAKLAVNTFVTTKISYANMLAEICERLDGGNVDVVTSAIGRDSRIGSKYLKAALGYGGPCFPRDNIAMGALASSLGVCAPIPQATDTINQWQVARLKNIVKSHLPSGGSVGVLGLSYKPKTNVVERSQGLELAQALLRDGLSVSVYDPTPMPNLGELLQGDAIIAGSAVECAQGVDVVVVSTPCDEFKALNTISFKRSMNQRATVIDCWRLLDRDRVSKAAHYLALGTCDMMPSRSVIPAPQPVNLPKAA
jgi:UDPglucose 6-dehydrogenase